MSPILNLEMNKLWFKIVEKSIMTLLIDDKFNFKRDLFI